MNGTHVKLQRRLWKDLQDLVPCFGKPRVTSLALLFYTLEETIFEQVSMLVSMRIFSTLER